MIRTQRSLVLKSFDVTYSWSMFLGLANLEKDSGTQDAPDDELLPTTLHLSLSDAVGSPVCVIQSNVM